MLDTQNRMYTYRANGAVAGRQLTASQLIAEWPNILKMAPGAEAFELLPVDVKLTVVRR